MKTLKLAPVLCMLFVSTVSFAQNFTAKYNEEAENVRKSVWGWERPEFKKYSVPVQYRKASKVIIARHLEVNADTKRRVGFLGNLSTLSEIMRESVMVNDKSAVQEYSEISYTQLERKSAVMMTSSSIVYVGVKVIKPDGSWREIKSDDVVLTKDSKSQKEAKLAVPDLQPGDVIDYFIAKQTKMSQLEKLPEYTLLFSDDAPVMHLSVRIEMGKRYSLKYRSYNGAPDFRQTTSEDGDIVLDAAKENMPGTEGILWTSSYRQLPMIRTSMQLGNVIVEGKKIDRRGDGEVFKDRKTSDFLDDKLREVHKDRMTRSFAFPMGNAPLNRLRQLKRARKNISTDSLAREVFYVFRYVTFLEQDGTRPIDKVIAQPSFSLNENLANFYLGEFMRVEKVLTSTVYSTLNKGPRMNEVLTTEDFNNIIKVRDAKVPYYGLENIFTIPGVVPSYLENSHDAVAVDLKGEITGPRGFEKSGTDIPGSSASENMRIERLDISLSGEPNLLEVKRQSTLRGHYKASEQQRLVLFEDYYEDERKHIGDAFTLLERLGENKKTVRYSEELTAAFAAARKNNKESFIEEAKTFFNQDIKDINNYKVENIGARHTNPDFVYSSSFRMGGIVKKAGTSFVIEIGKIQGGQLTLEAKQRTRTLDVYAPFARSLQYNIRFVIPEGYTAEGVEALNRKVENATGYFICEAVNTGKAIELTIKKSYNHSFEPAANWPQMVNFIEAANNWENSKIVLKKK